MENRKLYRLEAKTADRILGANLVLFCAFAVVSLVRGEPWAAVISCVVACVVLAWRFWKGPMVGLVTVEVGEGHLMFNDPAFMGKAQFALADVVEIRIVGPRTDRRIRVQSKEGKVKEAYRGLRGRRLAQIEAFLRENLPANITVIEDEPPDVLSMIRGDF